MENKNKIYMYVSDDVFELPIAEADSIEDLADQIGVTANTIRTQLYKVRKGLIKHSRYIEIDLDDEDVELVLLDYQVKDLEETMDRIKVKRNQ